MVKVFPPQFAGISVNGSKSELIRDVPAKDRRHWTNKQKDFLKFVIELLSNRVVQKRAFDEFEAESTLQLLVSEDPSATILFRCLEVTSEEKKNTLQSYLIFTQTSLLMGRGSWFRLSWSSWRRTPCTRRSFMRGLIGTVSVHLVC